LAAVLSVGSKSTPPSASSRVTAKVRTRVDQAPVTVDPPTVAGLPAGTAASVPRIRGVERLRHQPGASRRQSEHARQVLVQKGVWTIAEPLMRLRGKPQRRSAATRMAPGEARRRIGVMELVETSDVTLAGLAIAHGIGIGSR